MGGTCVAAVHDLLWAVRGARRGEEARTRRRRRNLPPELGSLLDAPLAQTCARLAERLTSAVDDPRSADACIRFHGLGRLPEEMSAIGASISRRRGQSGSLGVRRVRQLVAAAEAELADDLAREPLHAGPHVHAPPLATVFSSGAVTWTQKRVLLRAWADVPDGDHQSANALLLFEEEAGVRPASGRPLHREARRRLLRRAHAIVEVAIARGTGEQRASLPGVDVASELLLGPRERAATGLLHAIAEIVRARERPGCLDVEAMWCLCDHARDLVHTGSPDAVVLLGIARDAIAREGSRAPVGVAMRVLALSTIQARWQDDPAGFPAAWEGLRLLHAALAAGSGTEAAQGARPTLVSQGLRTLQELAELQHRFGFADEAMRTLGCAHELLDQHGDPEAEEEPHGWLQQLLYTQGLVQRHASRTRADPEQWMVAAQSAAARSVELVQRTRQLPDEWGLSAQAILVESLVDEAEYEMSAGAGRRAQAAIEKARRLMVDNELGWRTNGTPTILPSRSARLATIRSACRLALLVGDPDEYRHHRQRAAGEAGAWLMPSDIEELDALEDGAERLGIRRVGLAAKGLQRDQRIGQRMWARSSSGS